MPSVCVRLSLASLVMLLASCATAGRATDGTVTAYVDLERPTVVAFIPTSVRESPAAAASATGEQVKAAIERARACLGQGFASYRVVYADRIVVRGSGREESFDIASLAPLVGALLLRPEANARILFAGGGPEALRTMLPRAVSDYFGKKCEGYSRVKRSSKTRHVPNGATSGRGDGVPLLGMAKSMKEHAALNRPFRAGRATWAQSPNAKPIGEAGAKRVHGLREAMEKAG